MQAHRGAEDVGLEGEGVGCIAALPRRAQLWRQGGGEHADGPMWDYGARLLQGRSRSETELAYSLQGRVVHCVVLQKER